MPIVFPNETQDEAARILQVKQVIDDGELSTTTKTQAHGRNLIILPFIKAHPPHLEATLLVQLGEWSAAMLLLTLTTVLISTT